MGSDAEALKDQGNAFFRDGNFLKAAALFTQAIRLDPENAVLYSNRCAAMLRLKRAKKALGDAEKCTTLRPEWAKGHFRLGCVLEELGRHSDALAAYRKASDCDSAVAKDLGTRIARLERKAGTAADNTTAAAEEEEEEKSENASAPAASSQPLSKDTPIDAIPKEVQSAASGHTLSVSDGPDKFVQRLIAALQATFDHAKHIESMCYLPSGLTVGMGRAFMSPDTLRECVAFLRAKAAEESAAFACVVARKSDVAYPQTWRGKTSKQWPFAAGVDGAVVQLESAEKRGMWFLPVSADGKALGEPVPVDIDSLAISPPIISTRAADSSHATSGSQLSNQTLEEGPEVVAPSQEVPSEARKSAAAHTYSHGYKRWDSFDVDQALNAVDES